MTTDTRSEHIAHLTRQIEAGTYRVNGKQIVDGMMAKTWGELNPTEREVATRAIHHQNRRARLNLIEQQAQRLANEAEQQAAASTRCPVHHIFFRLESGDRNQDCWRCKWEQEKRERQTPPPAQSDNAYGGGWSAYHGKVTWFDWTCITACLVVGLVLLVMVFK